MSAPRLWKEAHVNVLDVGARDAQRHKVFGLTGGRAGMTAYAARLVYDLRPLCLILGCSFRLLIHPRILA
jgi:hypothetical protein